MDERARAAIRSWIEQQHDNVAHSSYYVLLGVAQGAAAPEIRDKYYRLVARLHPDLYGDALDAATRAKLVSLYSRLVEAYQVLTDPPRREQYDQGLAAGKLRWTIEDGRAARPNPESTISNASSRRLYLLAKTSLKNGDVKAAVMNLKMALTTEPKNELLLTELAQVEALLKKPQGG